MAANSPRAMCFRSVRSFGQYHSSSPAWMRRPFRSRRMETRSTDNTRGTRKIVSGAVPLRLGSRYPTAEQFRPRLWEGCE